MNIGDKQRVRCYDGVMRTGTVVWLRPGGIFAVFKFTTKQGATYCESILLNRSTPSDDLPDGRKLGKRYTPAEDKLVLQANTINKIHRLAKMWERSVNSICDRRKLLRKRQKEAGK